MPALKHYPAKINSSQLSSVESLCRYVEAHLNTKPEPLWPHQGAPWTYYFAVDQTRLWIAEIEEQERKRKEDWEAKCEAELIEFRQAVHKMWGRG